MLQLLGRANSVNVKKVTWCAAELGLELPRVDKGGPFGGLDAPDFLARNPNGLIPCLIDGDRCVWESNAIVRYLVAVYGNGALQGASAIERSQADQWMDWVLSTISAPFRNLFINLVRTAPEKRDAVAMENGRLVTAERLAIADAWLAAHPWLSGDAFGMGDIPLGCYAYGWFEMPIERPELPHLADWYARLQAREEYRRHVMLPLT